MSAAVDKVTEWVSEALELRHGAAGDPEGSLRAVNPTEGYEAVLHELLRVRVRADRVDQLLTNAIRAKGSARRDQEAAEFEAERQYNEAATTIASKRVEFSSSRERHAEASLDSWEDKRKAFEAARLVSVTQEAYDIISQVHWQLNAIRTDLREMIRALQFESSLER